MNDDDDKTQPYPDGGGPPFSDEAGVLADDPKPWRVLSSVYLDRKPWHTVRLEKVELPGGAVINEYWINEYAPWVNVVALTTDERVVLIRQYRHGIGQVHFELPAGTTDAGDESLETAARRELTEETGYGGGRWSLLMTLSANPALTNNLTYTYLAEGVTVIAAPDPEESEDIRVHLVPLSKIAALIESGGMVQALHTAPLLKLLLERQSR
jgi:8-oxo-dGTP pyrophosphatase MutT (NUDIX family)